MGERIIDGAHSGALVNSRLVKLIEIWPTLGEDVVEAILQLAGLRPDKLADVREGVRSSLLTEHP